MYLDKGSNRSTYLTHNPWLSL